MKRLIRRTDFFDVWNKFVSGSATPQEVPANIRQSWERCRQAQVDPRKEGSLMRLEQSALRKRSTPWLDLQENLQTHYKNVEKYFSFLPVCLFFADQEGTIRFLQGDDKIIKRMEQSSQTTLIGSTIKECVLGTTAPGICLEENRFAAVSAEEHYLQAIHWAGCIASPILDADQNLLGVLDFTVAWEDTKKLSQLIPLLLNTVHSIQFELTLKRKFDQLELYHSYYHSTFDYSNSILVLADTGGHVIDLNQQALEFFKVSHPLLKNRDIRSVLEHQGDMEDLFRSSGNKVYLDGRKTGTCSAESIPIFNQSGEEIAYLLRFEKERRVKTIPERTLATPGPSFSHIIGSSTRLIQVLDRARKAAKTGSTILIEGETGTGKELLAQGIHSESPYRNGPFVALNCAAIPRDLMESELFGYEKGAYTGALREGNQGKFELANGGTFFLDEIQMMSPTAQGKILRVIEERYVTRIGGKTPIPLHLRIIVASSSTLRKEVEKGLFVPALFFRLNVVRLTIPALRERIEDLPLLIDHFIRVLNRKFGRSIQGVEPAVLHLLSQYHWPGNIRELQNGLEHVFNFCEGNTIGLRDIEELFPPEAEWEAAPGQTMQEINKKLLIRSLRQHGKVKEAAESLGIPLSTFYRKMKEFRLDRESVLRTESGR